MSHTPGPWKVAENLFGSTASYEVYTNIETKSGKGGYTRICQITPRDQKANARLIAAAPELLAVLERVQSMFSYQFEGGLTGCMADLSIDVRAAIAKATGEQQ